MSNKAPSVHTVRIQQSYWVKDTGEERLLQAGAVLVAREVSQVDYYDTDTYELAMNKTWLSKSGGKWQLIIDQSGTATTEENTDKAEAGRTDGQSEGKYNEKATKATDQTGTSPLACYELLDEQEIVAHLSLVLHNELGTVAPGHETGHRRSAGTTLSDFIQTHGISHYSSFHNITRATYSLRGTYTVILSAEEATGQQYAHISLNVEIDGVTQGFQRMEQLASELDFLPQTKA
ncbi:uncharacterized protein LOC108698169 [Xenopus laevis]|uniref:Uncharacterized protein n=2 Tax=Xenopus laevis TaxID=8355 RepID=A0A974H7B9_XENLA|nr:uncharacterized protein LOC108698169 [Xenopus laevis]OCT66991.1 hypothetical protein XELAEV_18038274mg [Xenopus laevis]